MTDKTEARRILNRQTLTFAFFAVVTAVVVFALLSVRAQAASLTMDFTSGADETGAMGTLDILFLFLILALAPSMLLMMTSFTRIVIVMSFLRNAMGTQQSPPNQIIIGLALMLSLFIMTPVLQDVNTVAYEPYREGLITQEEMVEKAVVPVKQFMIRQTDAKSLNLFLSIAGRTDVRFTNETAIEVMTEQGLEIIVPAFITSELNKAFMMGFLIFLPFLIIDMVVSSILMSMGMVMLPPAMIALPFKLMMFIMVDGWTQVMGTLASSFH